MRFLLLDDNADDRLLGARLLQQEFPDALIDEAYDRAGFEQALARGAYDAVVTDYSLRWTDGIRTLERVKKAWPDCPVVLFTGSGNEEVAVAAMKAGADDYVMKSPKHSGRLPHAVRHALERALDKRRLAEIEAEREALQERLEARMAELQEADRLKNEFLAMLAHELRNPLAPIASAAYLLRLKTAADPDPNVKRACDVVERQVRALARLVDDLLDVSRVSQGKITLKREEMDLGVAVVQAVETARPLIEARRQELRAEVPSSPVRVYGDLTRLAQVFSNLLNNAAKFTPEGGRIAIVALREGAEARVSVTDTGIGMSPALLPRIFEPFTQGDVSLDRAQGGLGIGLMLVKRLVELHGGSVIATSPGTGRGSEFTVRIPAVES